MVGVDDSHGVACPFCGTTVRRGFDTCSSCGASYQNDPKMFGTMIVVFLVFGWIIPASVVGGLVYVLGGEGKTLAGYLAGGLYILALIFWVRLAWRVANTRTWNRRSENR